MDQLEGLEGLTEIGRGGFGVVYKATETDLNRTVAVKVLNEASADLAHKRLDRERRAMGVLSGHPNIVTIYRTGMTGGSPYLVMEFLGGGSLADRLQHGPPVPWEEAVNIGTALADAVEAAHRAGVLHRDIKPANVLLSDNGVPKLGDFGIANVEAVSQTSGVMKATVAHAPPEVLSGSDGDARADVYSLASTIYELIVGRPAFVRPEDTSPVPVLMRITSEPVPDIDPAICPPAVTRCLQQAMAKDPDHRPATAADFRQFLISAHNHAAAGGGPGHVHRPPETGPGGTAPGQGPGQAGVIPAPPPNIGAAPPPNIGAAPPPNVAAPAVNPQTGAPPLADQQTVHAFAPQPPPYQTTGGTPPPGFTTSGPVGFGGRPGLGPDGRPANQPPSFRPSTGPVSTPGSNNSVLLIVGGIIAAMVVIAGAAIVLTRGGDDEPDVQTITDPGGTGDPDGGTGDPGGDDPDATTSTETTAVATTPVETTPSTPPPTVSLLDPFTVQGRVDALNLLAANQLITTQGFDSLPTYPGSFTSFSDGAGVINVQVPDDWVDRRDATEFGTPGIQVADDLPGTETGAASSGVVVFLYQRDLLEQAFNSSDPSDLLDEIIALNEINCSESIDNPFSYPQFAGSYRVLTSCASSDPDLMGLYMVGTLSADSNYVMQVTLLTSEPESIAAAQASLDSIQINLDNL